MAEGRVLAVGASGDAGAVFAALSTDFTVHADPAQTLNWTWLDTADWRVRRVRAAVREERQGRTRHLVLDLAGQAAVSVRLRRVSWPARLDALDPDDVPDELAAVVGVRALLPVAEVEARRILLRLMDDAGKTRVRVTVDQQRLLTPRRAALPLHVVVRAVRGYDRDAERCVRLLEQSLGASSTALAPTDAALAAAGTLPGAPDADRVVVDPQDPAVRAVAAALLEDVLVVDRTREGAIADLDTEFLHDLRGAIRATRALLSAAGHLLPGRSAVRVERDLGWLEQMTTALRSVDIALLGLAEHELFDVADLQLDAVREQLNVRRRAELRTMRRTLQAPRAPAAFTAWRADLGQMIEADLIGPTVAESARALIDTTAAGVAAASDDELGPAVRAMREVLSAFASVWTPRAQSLADDLDALHELTRRRDGLRIVQEQVRDAAIAGHRGATLSAEDLLAAGVVLERASRAATALEAQIRAGRDHLTDRRAARRLQELTTQTRDDT